MRKNSEPQRPLAPVWPNHRLSDELRTISKILDKNPEILDLVLQDLSDKVDPQNGSPGLSAEQLLRCAVLKNWHQLSYEKLAFHLADSESFRGVLPLTLRVGSGQELSAGEPQSNPGRDLGGDRADPGPMGEGPRTGAGTQDPGGCDKRPQPHPPSF